MLRRDLHLPFSIVALLSFFLCVATTALWVQGHRARLVRENASYTDRGNDWIPHSDVVSLEPGGILLQSVTTWAIAKQDHLSGPDGEQRILVRDPPRTGVRWAVDPPSEAWDWELDRNHLTCEHLRFATATIVFPNNNGGIRQTLIPLYPFAIATAVLPTLWLCRRLDARLARRRAAAGLCPRCAFDLRASPGRCPECGATTPPQPPEPRPLPRLRRGVHWPLSLLAVSLLTLLLAFAALPLFNLTPTPRPTVPMPPKTPLP